MAAMELVALVTNAAHFHFSGNSVKYVINSSWCYVTRTITAQRIPGSISFIFLIVSGADDID